MEPTQWFTLTQKHINDYVLATGDDQWIHTDVERARRESPFGGTIAHGFLTLSLISRFMAESLEIKGINMAVNYGLNKVRFIEPVPAGGRIRMKATLTNIETAKQGTKAYFNCTLELDGATKPACIAETIVLFV